jgi:hypothetical protein
MMHMICTFPCQKPRVTPNLLPPPPPAPYPSPPTWRGLAADDAHAGDHGLSLRGRHVLDAVVAVDDAQHVEQLALVLVDALDLPGCVGVRRGRGRHGGLVKSENRQVCTDGCA